MKILFATNDPHLPQRFGGAYVSTHELAHALIQKGHTVALWARLVSGGKTYWKNRLKHVVTKRHFPSDRILGYPVYRGWGKGGEVPLVTHGLDEVFHDFAPDVVVAQGGQSMNLATAAAVRGVPGAVYLRDVEFNEIKGDPTRMPHIKYVANSEFTAKSFYSAFRVTASVIPPLVNPTKYRVSSSREAVLYVNPHPKKGLYIAVGLAKARPDIKFIFQESWVLSDENRRKLMEAIDGLPNVELLGAQRDMRRAYSRARLILVPSQWEEAWGRVATEAQVSGIPVLASDRGGLSESVGDGGILIPFDAPIEQWSEALSRLWDDEVSYARYAALALARSQRREIQPQFLLGQLESMLQTLVQQKTKWPQSLLPTDVDVVPQVGQ